MSVALGVFTPVSLLIALTVSPMFGYSELLLGRSFVLVGVFVGIAAVTALLSFFVCVLVLRITQLAISVERGDRP